MTANDPLAPIYQQIMWDRLIAVVEEQAQTLIRTGFSTSVREAGDVSAGVFDIEGRMLAQAVTGTPGHVNSMAISVGHFLRKFPVETMKPGDVFITNDPWLGTGHLHDFTVVTPTFRGTQPIALFASTCHVVDVGGRGLVADARQVYEEGLYVPIMRLSDAGALNETLIDMVRANVREPVQVVGDIYSLVACNDTGSRRLLEMMDEFALDRLERLAEHVIECSHAASLQALRGLRRGTYRNEMQIDGYDKPIRIAASLTVGENGIDIDFDGTSSVSAYGINVPLCYTTAYATFGVKCVVFPKVPNNAGTLAIVRVTAPENCILNAKHPHPVAVRHVTGLMLPDVIFGCLAQALPDGVPAEGSANLWNLMLMGGPGRVDADIEALEGATPFNVMSFHAGGMGARPGSDGLSATGFPSGVRNVAIEITEAISPIVVWKKEYRTDSGGAGTWRGGLGQTMEVSTLENAPFALSATFERIQNPARGRDGGRDGAAGRVCLSSGRTLRGKGHQTIPVGERLIIEMAGGGGLGDPRKRDRRLIAEDVKAGLVSKEAAEREYGCTIPAD